MSKCLVCSHDAGGAELLSAWAKQSPHQLIYMVDGPAIEIYKNKITDFKNHGIEQLSALLESVDQVVLSTSGHSNFERHILKAANEHGVKTISVLDHWVNYELRFNANGEKHLPQELWVCDEKAYDMASAIFKKTPIKLIENYYIKSILESALQLQSVRHSDAVTKVLYCAQPAIFDYGYTEFDALSNFLEHIQHNMTAPHEIKIRLHPAEQARKYEALIAQYDRNDFHIYEAAPEDLIGACMWADYVVGCDSMAMYIAHRLGKKVFSVIPKHGKPSSLPFSEIVPIFQ